MQRFTFRLESLRALRGQAEEQAKLRLARELAFEAVATEQLFEAGSRLAHARARVGAGAGSGDELAALQVFLERCEHEAGMAAAALTLRRQAVTDAREHLAEVTRDRQALERLRERKRTGHALEQLRVEGITLDEVGLAAHRRRVA
jgi:flagellar export protein FliJ